MAEVLEKASSGSPALIDSEASTMDPEVTSPVQEEIFPLRLGLKISPPALVVEYAQGDGPEEKKMQHRVGLNAQVLQHSLEDLTKALKSHKEHGRYLRNIEDKQLLQLLKRLKETIADVLSQSPPERKPVRAPRARSSAGLGRRGRSSPPKALLPFPPPGGLPGGSAAVRRPHALARTGLNLDGRIPLRKLRAPSTWLQEKPAEEKKEIVQKKVLEKVEDAFPTGAMAAWCIAGKESALQLSDLFEHFRTSRSINDAVSSFASLLKASESACPGVDLSTPASMPLSTIRSAVGSQRRFPRVLWERLDARLANVDYVGQPLAGKRAVIVGAGPVGLRSALELRLLGAEVVVLERRVGNERINRLHLWTWCGQDLKGWGAKVLEPPDLSFGADPDFLHIGISELQLLLLKPCLLLGVQVYFGAEFIESSRSTGAGAAVAGSGWDVLLRQATLREGQILPPGPQLPSKLASVDLLIGADGPRSVVANRHEFEMTWTSSLRKEAALGLVANYANRQTASDKGRRPFSLARQFYASLFQECEEKTGIALENIVCYISSQTHYFVMTPKLKSLQDAGVVAVPESPEQGALTKINQEKLAEVVKEVCRFRWKEEDPQLSEETLSSPVGQAALFDFSSTRRAAVGVKLVKAPSSSQAAEAAGLRSNGTGMLVGLCGDALIEPFWPEGLGIVRGFFAALDLASAAKVWAESLASGQPPEESGHAAEAHFETAFRQLKSLAAKTRTQVLRPDERAYALDPNTRYRFSGASTTGRHRANSMPAFVRRGGA
eukprot:TRINITY_DN65409_c0_g1_i1.p1 TRINITY_DN65409_c0_g1~~TRINITY_DN65409_c0_g1_i1.p1  ORF type:complete len:779 (+),score=198.28 TRINITY_DN65409_c0_g1_i1:74-2410(+)